MYLFLQHSLHSTQLAKFGGGAFDIAQRFCNGTLALLDDFVAVLFYCHRALSEAFTHP